MQTITGKIIEFIPKQEGESSRGHWVRAGFVIETEEAYPKTIAFSLFGEDRLQMCRGLDKGMQVKVDYSPESRKYQDRWFTDLKCIRVFQNEQTQAPAQAPSPTPAPSTFVKQPQPPVYTSTPDDSNDLPF